MRQKIQFETRLKKKKKRKKKQTKNGKEKPHFHFTTLFSFSLNSWIMHKQTTIIPAVLKFMNKNEEAPTIVTLVSVFSEGGHEW